MAFTGRAVYSDFDSTAEDVSDTIGMVSPAETPLLDFLGDSGDPADNLLYQWIEDQLSPNTIVASSAVSSDTANTVMGVAAGKAPYLQVGMILVGPSASGSEYMVVAAIAGNSITLGRAFGGTTANSFAAGQSISVLGDAALEGADVDQSSATDRVRKSNYCQIFKKDVILSGSEQAVRHYGVTSPFDYEKQKKIREAVRDLEKTVIMGILSGNTIGTSTARRTMNGIRAMITTNVQSVGATITDSWLGTAIQAAWTNGGTGLNLIVAGVNYKRLIDTFNATRTRTTNDDRRFSNVVNIYESTFGNMGIMLSRWMPASEALVLDTSKIQVKPLRGRSFQFMETAKTGDSMKGMVIGEYTLELKNEESMSRIV
jgi:hypothetical protein